MYREGDFVVAPELADALRRQGVELPADFSVDELFQGSVPDAKDVEDWLGELRKRASDASPMTCTAGSVEDLARTMPPVAVKALACSKRIKSEESHASSSVAVDSRSHDLNITQAWPVTEARKRVSKVAGSKSPAEHGAPTLKRKTKRASSTARPALPPSEAQEWVAYLEAVRQAPATLTKTGFRGLDDKLGGLRAGVHAVTGEDRDSVLDFLKHARGSDR